MGTGLALLGKGGTGESQLRMLTGEGDAGAKKLAGLGHNLPIACISHSVVITACWAGSEYSNFPM